MRRILLLTPSALPADPRAARAAAAALSCGWEVAVIDTTDDEGPPTPSVSTVHVRTGRATATLRRAGVGGPGHRGPLERELRGIFRLMRSALLNVRMLKAARGLGRFDVVHANDLDTLPAASVLARRWRARLVYDAHEIYSSQEPDAPRIHLALSSSIERRLAAGADAVVTVSAPIADELTARLRLRSAPFVVLNCPSLVDLPVEQPPGDFLRVVYQGAMGPGRDLADLLDAAEVPGSFHLTIRVANADLAALRKDVRRRNLEERISVVDPVDPTRLVDALAGFDVGLIINRPVTRNDELVLPNKLFEYLMAGLAVVAPALPSLREVIEEEEVGALFEPADPVSLGSALAKLSAEGDEVARMKVNARRAAVERYNAEAQRPALYAAWGS
jgi:glycogen synthase